MVHRGSDDWNNLAALLLCRITQLTLPWMLSAAAFPATLLTGPSPTDSFAWRSGRGAEAAAAWRAQMGSRSSPTLMLSLRCTLSISLRIAQRVYKNSRGCSGRRRFLGAAASGRVSFRGPGNDQDRAMTMSTNSGPSKRKV